VAKWRQWGGASLSLVAAAYILDTTVFDWARDTYSLIIQSDSLLPAALVEHFLRHGYALSGFQLPRVPSFVPDMVVYGVVQTISGDWRVAALVYGILAPIGISLAAGWIINAMTRCGFAVGVQLFLPIMIGSLLFASWRFVDLSPDIALLFIVLPVTHGGPFVLSLFAACCVWAELRHSTITRRLAIPVVTAIGTQSDLLFVTGFVMPMTVAVVRGIWTRVIAPRRGTVLLIGMYIGAAVGWWSTRMMFLQGLPPMRLSSTPNRVRLFVVESITEPTMIVALCATMFVCVVAIRPRILMSRLPAAFRPFADAYSFWWTFGASAALIAIGVTAALYQDVGSYRYAFPMMWWPPILAASAIAPFASGRRSGLSTVALVGIAAFVACRSSYGGFQKPALLAWRSPLEVCLSDASKTLGLRAGLAEYWKARLVAASSDWRMQVGQVTMRGEAYIWGNDPRSYLQDILKANTRPPYNFIIMDRLDAASILERYGKPDHVLDCPSSSVWVYDDTALFYAHFIAASPALAPVLLRRPK
jgi:hypothetical protein